MAWSKFLEHLSPYARSVLTKTKKENPLLSSYDSFLLLLSQEARGVIRSLEGEGNTLKYTKDSTHSFTYYVVENQNGDWPRVRAFKDLASLITFLHKTELKEEDVCLSIFNGFFLPVTRSYPRYLLLPDKQSAVKIGKGEPIIQLIRDLPDMVEDELGYFGPSEFLTEFKNEEK